MASPTSNLSRKEVAIKDLLAEIARALVDHPEGVQVRAVAGSQVTVLELKTHPEHLGKVIGRECPKEVALVSSPKLICLRFVTQLLPPALTVFYRSIQLRIAANPRGHPKRFRRVVRASA